MKITFKLITSLTLVYFAFSCTYDKQVVEPEIIVNEEVCDSITSTFSIDVLPLLKQKCTPCHIDGGNSGGYSWNNYADVEAEKDNILSAIKHEDGIQNMPRSADKLSNEDITKVECWIINGALDN